MRLVLDTNILISALLFDGTPEQLVLKVLGGSDHMVASPYIITETTHILRTKFKVDPATLQLLQQLLSDSELFYFEPFVHVLDDEPDNRILETAIQGNAERIITGDKLLLALKVYEGIPIVTVRSYLETLKTSDEL